MDSILKIEGNLIVKGRSMFPRPGQVQFEIQGAAELVGHLIDIKADALPEVATNDHISGKLTLEIFEKEIDNSAYEATLPKQSRKKPDWHEQTDNELMAMTPSQKVRKPRTKKVKDAV